MAGLTMLIDVAEAIVNYGIEDEGEIASLLESSGLDSGAETISAVRDIASSIGVEGVAKVAEEGGSITSKFTTTIGNVTSDILTGISTYPKTALLVGAGLAGVTLYGAYEQQQQAAAIANANPNAAATLYIVSSKGTQVVATKTTDTTTTENKGILGTILADLGFGLFGDTGTQIEKALVAAKPWLIGGAVVIGIVAIGYTVNSFRGGGSKSTLKLTV